MLHLAFTERALLADDMGLGKTVQAIAACDLLGALRGIERVLVVSPASLKQSGRSRSPASPACRSRIIGGPRAQRLAQYGEGAFFYLINYEQVLRDRDDQQRLAPDLIVLDEAQRIKNWQSRPPRPSSGCAAPTPSSSPARRSRTARRALLDRPVPRSLPARPALPLQPRVLRAGRRGRPVGYRNLDELHRRLAPVLLRRRKDEVEGQLPGRPDKHYFVPLEDEQPPRYADYERRVAQLARRRPGAGRSCRRSSSSSSSGSPACG